MRDLFKVLKKPYISSFHCYFKFCVPLFAGWQGFMNEDMILKEHGLN